MTPKQFRLKPGGFNEIRKQLLLKMAPILLLAVTAGIAIPYYSSRNEPGNVNTLPFVIPFTLVLLGFSLYRSVNKQRALWESYTLTVDETSVTREQANTPTVTLSKWEIAAINRQKNGSLVIRGNRPMDCIVVPAQMENYDELLAALNTIEPTGTAPLPFYQRYPLVISLGMLGLTMVAFVVTNKYILTLSGVAVAAILVWALYEGRRSRNIDRRTKRSLLWVSVVLLALVLRIVMAWINSSYLS